MKGPTREKVIEMRPAKRKYEEKGAYEDQNERNRHSKILLLLKNQKVSRVYGSLNPAL
jgi:hypothetical protein